MIKFNEAHKRTIGKSVSWRIIITLVQIINGLIVTGSLAFGIQMASLGAAVNIVLYWVHERVWNKIQWSREQAGSTYSEKWYRSISKDLSWRVIITFNNFWMPWVLTGSWKVGLSFVTVATIVNMFIYWSHERLWNIASFGKQVLDVDDTNDVLEK